MKKHTNRWKWIAPLFLGIVALDQWTKHVILQRFAWGESYKVITNFFDLTYVRNKGAAFGILNRAPDSFRAPFFIIVPIIALIVLGVIIYRLKEKERVSLLAFTLIFSGALANLIDRIRFGYVVDFLDFHWKEVYHYPAFNVADSCIVVGVGILFAVSFLGTRKTSSSRLNK